MIGGSLSGSLRAASEALLAPGFLAPARARAPDLKLFVIALVGAALIIKLTLILSGGAAITASDGASRLFVAMDRFGDADYFGSLSTWAALPAPLPQVFYSLLYGIDVATGGKVPVTISLLAVNATAFAGVLFCLSALVWRGAGPMAAALFASLGVAAATPNYIAMIEAVEPVAVLLFSAGALLSVCALSSPRPFLTALLGAGALSLATAFRLEYVVLVPAFAALLYSRLGLARVAAFAAAASSYAIVYCLLQASVDWAAPYSEIRRFYTVSIRPRTLQEFMNAALFTSGMKGVWGAPAFVFGLFAAVAGLASKRTRFFSLLALTALGFIVFAAMSGRVPAGQARYAMLPMCLLAMPAAAMLAEVVERLARRTPKAERLKAGVLGLAAALALVRHDAVIRLREMIPPATVEEMARALLARIGAGESAFFDYAESEDFALAVRTMATSGAPSYAYLSRCCVSPHAAASLGAEEVRRLTRDKTIIMPGLSANDHQQALQIWAHGFIERYRPRYFLVMRTKRLNAYARRLGWPLDRASAVLPFSTREGPDLRVKLRYADTAFRLRPIARNSRFVLYEAQY